MTYPNDYLDDNDTLPAEPIQLENKFNWNTFFLGFLIASTIFGGFIGFIINCNCV